MPFAAPLRLLLLDDHKLFRCGLMALLRPEPVLDLLGDAPADAAGLALAAALQPDIVLLDLPLQQPQASAMLQALRLRAPRSRLLMLSASADPCDLLLALDGGVQGYLLKNVDAGELLNGLLRVRQGDTVISPELTATLVQALRARSERPLPADGEPAALAAGGLSQREQAVLRELAQGASNKQIANQLAIAETTVKLHVQHIMRKLALGSRVQLALWAHERGLR